MNKLVYMLRYPVWQVTLDLFDISLDIPAIFLELPVLRTRQRPGTVRRVLPAW